MLLCICLKIASDGMYRARQARSSHLQWEQVGSMIEFETVTLTSKTPRPPAYIEVCQRLPSRGDPLARGAKSWGGAESSTIYYEDISSSCADASLEATAFLFDKKKGDLGLTSLRKMFWLGVSTFTVQPLYSNNVRRYSAFRFFPNRVS